MSQLAESEILLLAIDFNSLIQNNKTLDFNLKALRTKSVTNQ